MPPARGPRHGVDILFLTQTYPRTPEDSSGPFIRELARALVRGGDRVRVLAPHTRGLPARRVDDGVEVETFRYAPAPLEIFGYGRSLAADEEVRAGALLMAPLYALGAWRAVRRAVRRSAAMGGRGRPLPLEGQGDGGIGVECIQAHWLLPNGPLARGLASRLPFGIGIHGSDVFLAERRLARPWVRRTLAGASFVTGCSPELVDRVCALGYDREQARVIPYGVDADAFRPDPARRHLWRQRLGIPAEAPLLLGLGRMATKKGFQVLLPELPALLAALPAAHVVLAGAGDLLPRFRAQAAPLAGRVHFPGAVLRDTLPDLFRAADAFVLPAVHDRRGNVDGLPNVVL
ncbi:MAG TPA: glycosyltransferase, partial [Thermoanaerobaculia bacterium]|nr:glycosyltransferase [Thermoanaerobaculia bacterium]